MEIGQNGQNEDLLISIETVPINPVRILSLPSANARHVKQKNARRRNWNVRKRSAPNTICNVLSLLHQRSVPV